jgi:hypothetical protein
MIGMMFVVALILPPAVIALSAAALAVGSVVGRSPSPAQLRERHA